MSGNGSGRCCGSLYGGVIAYRKDPFLWKFFLFKNIKLYCGHKEKTPVVVKSKSKIDFPNIFSHLFSALEFCVKGRDVKTTKVLS